MLDLFVAPTQREGFAISLNTKDNDDTLCLVCRNPEVKYIGYWHLKRRQVFYHLCERCHNRTNIQGIIDPIIYDRIKKRKYTKF